jgi:hypothetical protein
VIGRGGDARGRDGRDERAVEVHGAGALVPRHGGALDRRAAEGLPPDGHLGLAPGLLRAPSWNLLPAAVADRLEQLAGRRIEWWARPRGGTGTPRPLAVLLGTAGAVFADPGLTTAHASAYAISCYVLDPGSLVRVRVVARPDPPAARSAPGAAGAVLPADRGPSAHLGAPPGTDAATAAVMASMPVRAVELLTAPFRDGAPVLRSGHHYEGTTDRLDVFGLVLAGARHVTFASGSRLVPLGHTEQTAHWALVCARADVVRRIGT